MINDYISETRSLINNKNSTCYRHIGTGTPKCQKDDNPFSLVIPLTLPIWFIKNDWNQLSKPVNSSGWVEHRSGPFQLVVSKGRVYFGFG